MLALLHPTGAHAQSCSVTTGAANYGPIDILAGSAVTTSTNFTVSCTGVLLLQVGLCVQFDQGSPNSNNSIRYMTNGATTVQHELYSDAARTQVWGSWGYGTTAYGSGGVAFTLPLSLAGTGSHIFTVYGTFKAAQTTAPTGVYTWSSNSPQINYGYVLAPNNCSSQVGGNNVNAGSSPWTATINANCNISTATLNFGSASLLTSNIDATGTVSAQCTSNSPYSIGLDNGLNASGSQRRMRLGATSSFVNYDLFTDSGRSHAWTTSSSASSCTGGANSCALDTGTSLTRTVTVYGRVPPQTAPTPGSYSDSVIATVTY